ncbi:MAG: MBL fold metallo-hydrolase [Candidatus Sungbacteria bacterium]|uniref:MBL fold metallo-hydrolase n=1 Tax=Candidatus Sungiibacteriota bacterium TaxID=2750080 RepID=A0A932YWJ4_9BACT|nr:MBL fold metallo-hydrolase [Candidatus Sungbacteria bacterium]
MTISWYGQSCFRIDTREATMAIDPFSKEIGLTPPHFKADVLLLTHQHPDHANAGAIPGEPFLVAGPGEYETRGISITGIPTFHDRKQGNERGLNTAYRIALAAEGIVLAHLGDFGEEALREETLEAIGDIDILFIPVGGTYTIDGETAAKVVNQIEPRLAIPMHYALAGLKVKLAPVDDFLKAYGTRGAERLQKLSLKKKELPEEETRVVILTAGA